MAQIELVKEQRTLIADSLEADDLRRICFVCTGNTCRSPMAEAVANAIIAREGRTDLSVCSAGLFANEGESITSLAVQALEDAEIPAIQGHDYHTHTAHALCPQEIGAYDLIVAMTDAHVMQLMMRFPEVAEKITVMPVRIPDPFGGDLAVYRECLSQICEGVRALLGSEAL